MSINASSRRRPRLWATEILLKATRDGHVTPSRGSHITPRWPSWSRVPRARPSRRHPSATPRGVAYASCGGAPRISTTRRIPARRRHLVCVVLETTRRTSRTLLRSKTLQHGAGHACHHQTLWWTQVIHSFRSTNTTHTRHTTACWRRDDDRWWLKPCMLLRIAKKHLPKKQNQQTQQTHPHPSLGGYFS